jgi:hypothetical protein
MGQGLYNALGLGLLDPPMPKDDDERERLYELTLDIKGLDYTYECEPEYMVIRLAADDECLQDWWKVPALPDDVLRCAPRRARYADDVRFAVPEGARKQWDKAAAEFAKTGITLPAPRLVVLNDWD